jgi:hypothetical protein
MAQVYLNQQTNTGVQDMFVGSTTSKTYTLHSRTAGTMTDIREGQQLKRHANTRWWGGAAMQTMPVRMLGGGPHA